MKKFFQTIIDKDRLNCMQAEIASLLKLPIEGKLFTLYKCDVAS